MYTGHTGNVHDSWLDGRMIELHKESATGTPTYRESAQWTERVRTALPHVALQTPKSEATKTYTGHTSSPHDSWLGGRVMAPHKESDTGVPRYRESAQCTERVRTALPHVALQPPNSPVTKTYTGHAGSPHDSWLGGRVMEPHKESANGVSRNRESAQCTERVRTAAVPHVALQLPYAPVT